MQAPGAARKLLASQQTDQVAVNITVTANTGSIENITIILSGAVTSGAIQQALQQNGLSVTNVQNITVNVISQPAAAPPGAPLGGQAPAHSRSSLNGGSIAGITAGAAVAVGAPCPAASPHRHSALPACLPEPCATAVPCCLAAAASPACQHVSAPVSPVPDSSLTAGPEQRLLLLRYSICP